MTQSPASASSVVEPSWRSTAWRPGRVRRLLRAFAVVSCLPYLSLKAAWIAGSHLGIPDGSPLLEHRGTMAVLNGVTVLMDGAVIVLALLLTRPWGMRVPPWLLALPLWVATGLLAPIMVGFPLQLLVKAFGGSVGEAADTGREPFLAEWVFGVVYTGFIVQGLALGALFVLYAGDRWGHLWRGRTGNSPGGFAGTAQRRVAVAAAVIAPFPLTVHLLWACGATAGLSEARIRARTAEFPLLQTVDVVFLAAAVLGACALAFRHPRALPVKVPLVLAWIGSGAVACWGAWLSLASLGGVDDIAERPAQLMYLIYAGQMITGMLVATVGALFLAERSAAPPRHAG